MKKLLLLILLCLALTVAATAVPYGYHDPNLDGIVDISDALTLLHDLLQDRDTDIGLLRVLQTLRCSVAGETVTATVASVDAESGAVTLSTPRGDGIVASLAELGITDADTDALDSSVLTVTLFDGKVCAAKHGVRAARPETAENRPLSIKVLNTKSEEGSHAEDDFRTSSVEVNYRETVDLTKEDHHRYRLAFYPRIKKVKDDLYILAHHVNTLGAHTYIATSEDSIHWNAPTIMFQNNTEDKVITYTDGPLAGTTDRLVGVNPDACVLQNGEILYVFAVRPNHGYHDYPDYSGIYLMRGTVGEDNTITWSDYEQITVGQVWEPFIWQRADGQVEIYWSNPAPYMTRYGYDYNIRSAGVSMISSTDNGHTWSPSIEEGKESGYIFHRVYNEYIGDSYGQNKEGGRLHALLPYFAGQMPAVTRLYDGRSLLGAEVRQLDQTFDFSFATSEVGGDWASLALTEDGPDTAHKSVFDAAGPYLATFPSGEVYLTYHWAGKQYYKMGDPKGTAFTNERYIAVPGAGGMWGSSELVGSHEIISAGQLETAVTTTDTETGETTTTYEYGIELVHSYLNHRINAQKFAVLVDGYTDDWAYNTDALFVGSETQAQIAVQVAHDKDNVYFLLSRLDATAENGDSITLLLNGSVTVTVGADGSYTVGTHSGTGVAVSHEGVGTLIELAVPKDVLGLVGKTAFTLCPTLTEVENGKAVTDTFANAARTAYHPKVVLE